MTSRRVLPACFLLALAVSCVSRDSDPPQQGGVAESDTTGAPASAANSEAPYTGNIVTSGGRVEINIGAMKGIHSSDPIKHIHDHGVPGVTNERMYLRTVALDTNSGTTIEFELNYLDEDEPVDIVQNGYLSLQDQTGPRRIAKAGTVTVLRKENAPWVLSFAGLQMEEFRTDGAVPVKTESIASGSVVGDVQRVCVAGLEKNPGDPFCEVQP